MKDLERLLEKLPGKDQVKHLENLLGKDQVKLLGKEVANSSQHAKEKLTESIQMEFAQTTSSLALVELLASWTAQLLSSSIQQFLFVTGHGTSLNALDFQLHSQHAKRTDTSHSDNAHRHSLLALTAVPSSCSVQQDSSSPSLPYVATTSPMFPNAKRRRVKNLEKLPVNNLEKDLERLLVRPLVKAQERDPVWKSKINALDWTMDFMLSDALHVFSLARMDTLISSSAHPAWFSTINL